MGERLARIVVIPTVICVVFIYVVYTNLSTSKTFKKLDIETYNLAKKEFNKISFNGTYVSFSNVDSELLDNTNFSYKSCRYVNILLDKYELNESVSPYFFLQDEKLSILFESSNGLALWHGNTEYSLGTGMKVYKKSGDSNLYFIDGNKTYKVPFLLFLDM